MATRIRAPSAPCSQILGGRRSPSPNDTAYSAVSIIANTSFASAGRSTTDISGTGMANIATAPGKAIVQSGIVAQSLEGQGDPSAMPIIGAIIWFIMGAEAVALTPA